MFCDHGVKFVNEDDLIDLPGFGTYTCQTILDAGLSGTIPESLCSLLTVQVVGSNLCQCDSDSTFDEDVGWPVQNGIFRMEGNEGIRQDDGQAPYAPLWQTLNALVDKPPNMYDQMTEPGRAKAIQQVLDGPTVVFSDIISRQEFSFYEAYGGLPNDYGLNVYYPIFDPTSGKAVGVALIEVILSQYVRGALPADTHLMDIVIESSCGQSITSQPNEDGTRLENNVVGDTHDSRYTHLARGTTFEDFEASVSSATTGLHTKSQDQLEYCRYRFVIYPRKELEDEFVTNRPLYYSLLTCAIFLFTTIVFGKVV
jgi:hypothetical protein